MNREFSRLRAYGHCEVTNHTQVHGDPSWGTIAYGNGVYLSVGGKTSPGVEYKALACSRVWGQPPPTSDLIRGGALGFYFHLVSVAFHVLAYVEFRSYREHRPRRDVCAMWMPVARHHAAALLAVFLPIRHLLSFLPKISPSTEINVPLGANRGIVFWLMTVPDQPQPSSWLNVSRNE